MWPASFSDMLLLLSFLAPFRPKNWAIHTLPTTSTNGRSREYYECVLFQFHYKSSNSAEHHHHPGMAMTGRVVRQRDKNWIEFAVGGGAAAQNPFIPQIPDIAFIYRLSWIFYSPILYSRLLVLFTQDAQPIISATVQPPSSSSLLFYLSWTD